jgi:predicted alpha/beta hydrolase
MKTQNLVILAKDGYQLSAILKEPETQPIKGVIQIQCGAGLKQSFYANFASFLTQNGYATLTFDYRGIGKSKPKSLKGFEASLIQWAQLDMTAVFDWVIENYPNHKKILFGHSMGGQLVGLMENNNQIDHLFLAASGTGFWKEMNKPYRYIIPPICFFILIPFYNFFFGYIKAKKVKQGEDLPSGVGLQWRRWCIDKNYFDAEFKKLNIPLYYNKIKVTLTSIQISDDIIANDVTSNKILKYYSNAKISVNRFTPQLLNVEKIGHTGLFSRRFQDSIWTNILNNLN